MMNLRLLPRPFSMHFTHFLSSSSSSVLHHHSLISTCQFRKKLCSHTFKALTEGLSHRRPFCVCASSVKQEEEKKECIPSLVGAFRKRLRIADIKSEARIGEHMTVRGWIRTCRIQKAFAFLEDIAEKAIVHITYTDAITLLSKANRNFEYPVRWGSDLQSEHERYITEEAFKGTPVIVTDYPQDIKAFYMRQNDDGKTVAAMDLLVPRVGELIGGSQREERLDVLEKRIEQSGLKQESYWWYLDLRRYGTVPHSGFGLGFERLLQFATGIENIRDAIPFPRVPGSAEF